MSDHIGPVRGHGLVMEGRAHVVNIRGEVVPEWGFSGVGGLGRGLCSCGELSPLLPSAGRRKAWHRQHKADVIAGAAS